MTPLHRLRVANPALVGWRYPLEVCVGTCSLVWAWKGVYVLETPTIYTRPDGDAMTGMVFLVPQAVRKAIVNLLGRMDSCLK